MIHTYVEWRPEDAAIELLGGMESGSPARDYQTRKTLELKIREAIVHGKLKAERADLSIDWPDGRIDKREDYVCKPADVIEWALANGEPVPDEYRDWYHEITKGEKRGPKGGARELNLYKVIAGLALVHGYKPKEKKQAQDFRASIVRELDKAGIAIDPDRITDVIREAFERLNKP